MEIKNKVNRNGDTTAYKIFSIFNYTLLIGMALLCVLPMVNIFAISLSSANKAEAGMIGLWPQEFTLRAYSFALGKELFWKSMLVTFERTILGTAFGMFLTVTSAYALSKDSKIFKARRYYVWFFFFTMLFSGGLIPSFLMVYYTGIYDSLWALVIPGAVSVWNTILMLNFFRQHPKELEDAACIDGAGHWTILWQIFIPISKPALATVSLFTIVAHWNSWFDGMLYIKQIEHQPMQTYLRSLLNIDIARFLTGQQLQEVQKMSSKTLRAAQIFIAALPILAIYPFLQKYFTKGLVLGSVKE